VEYDFCSMATVKNKEHDKASRFVVEFVDSILEKAPFKVDNQRYV
jgi:hypothetical protein